MVFEAQVGQPVIITVRPYKGVRGRVVAVGAGENNRIHQVGTDRGMALVHCQDLIPVIAGENGRAAKPEPDPLTGKREVLPAVIADLRARSDFGLEKYGTRLMTHNGRNALMDAYQEALDQVMYLKQVLMEQEGEND